VTEPYVTPRIRHLRDQLDLATVVLERIKAETPAGDVQAGEIVTYIRRTEYLKRELARAESRLTTPSVTVDDWSPGWHDVFVSER
jgi:hypothetical protein